MSDLLNCQIADALEKCDWAGVSIGDKLIVLSAIEALRKTRPAPAATDTGLETVAWEKMDSMRDPNDKLVYEVKFPRNGDKRLVYKSQADKLLAERNIIIRSHLTTIATLNANNAAFEELCGLTFAIQHNPNCPAKFLVRLPGKSGRIDMKPYADRLGFIRHQTGDVLGFGKTLHEAARIALLRAKA